jgi:endoglucanase
MLDFDSNNGLLPVAVDPNPLIIPPIGSLVAEVPLTATVPSPNPPAAAPLDFKSASAATAAIDPLTGSGIGLFAEYYDNVDFTNLKKTSLDAQVNFDWGLGAPDQKIGADTFSVRWTGQVQPRYSEVYTFKSTGDDGVRLWVNGQEIITAWKNQPATEQKGSIALEAGQKYDIRLEYYENGGQASQKLAWVSNSQQAEIIPTSQLYPVYKANDTIPSTIDHSYSVAKDTIGLRVNSGGVLHRQQVLYQTLPGDQRSGSYITREGKPLGRLLADGKTITLFESVVGAKLDLAWSDRAENYRVTSTDDPNFAAGVVPLQVSRKTKPSDSAEVASFKFEQSEMHDIFLKLPFEMQAGKNYKIDFVGDEITDANFQYAPDRTFSEAVHINQLGFDPDDLAKVGYLSTWTGSGGGISYQPGTKFWLIDNATDAKVFEGSIQLTKAKDDNTEMFTGKDFSKTDVYQMDFSTFKTPGNYRLAVEGVGTSFAFEIANNTWDKAFTTAARGFYHQRSGLELTAPYTNATRPRSFHPDDGVQVYKSNLKIMDADMGIGKKDTFKELVAQSTTEIMPNAWGGWRDAGDWDRRIQHSESSRQLLELADLFPEYIKNTNLNIPESQNNLPDLVDEALWNVDFFKRLQSADGSVSGGIESADHPKYGEASWQESLKVYAYAPDMWSSFQYASMAAKAADVVGVYDLAKAQDYKDSAIKAMNWAEQEFATKSNELTGQQPNRVRDARNLAAAELFALTGEDRWHQIFINTTIFQESVPSLWSWDSQNNFPAYNQEEAAFLYSRTDRPGVLQNIKTNARNSIVRWADIQLQLQNSSAFKQSAFNGYAPVTFGNGLGVSHTMQMLEAHALTNNDKYLRAATLANQFTAGANPDNMVYTTGLGQRSPKNPLIIDQRMTDKEISGITLYGPNDISKSLTDSSKLWVDTFRKSTSPQAQDWPIAESYFDIFMYPAVTEYTLMQTMSPTSFAWGYIAATSNGYKPTV